MEYSVKDKARMMSKTKWGKSLSADDLANLAPYLEVKNFARGQAIFVQDEKGSNMAFILKGSVDVIKDVTDTRDTIVVQLGAGNNCGEFSFIDDLPRSASVLPREDTQVLLLEKKDFREPLQGAPGHRPEISRTAGNPSQPSPARDHRGTRVPDLKQLLLRRRRVLGQQLDVRLFLPFFQPLDTPFGPRLASDLSAQGAQASTRTGRRVRV